MMAHFLTRRVILLTLISMASAVPRHGWNAYHDGNYFFFSDERLNWRDARDACVELGGHLVEIGSSAEQTFLESVISDIDDASTFPMPQIQMCEHDFRNQGQAATLNCQAGTFIDLIYVNYGRTRPYGEICNYGHGIDLSTCGPQDVVTQRARDACQGRSSCQLTYSGLSLWDTCPNTYKYLEVRYTCTTQVAGDQYRWIGLNDLNREGQFLWENTGRPGYYSNWHDNQPDNHVNTEGTETENCGIMWTNNMWNDAMCSSEQRFICEL